MLMCKPAAQKRLVFVFFCVLKRAVYEMFVGLMTVLGQNLVCLSETLVQFCSSSVLAVWLSPSFLLSPVVQKHICCSAELCWRGEEVGADCHMIKWMWSKGEQKEEEWLF